MKVTGTHTLRAPRQKVWDALCDPQVLVRTLPGCQRLEAAGPYTYRVTVAAGVASIKGVYAGTLALSDLDAPAAYTLRASGQGGPGTIEATARVWLHEADGGGTRVEYDADAVVGGTVAGVGQRVLAGVAKRNAAEFFSAVEREVLGVPLAEAPAAAAVAPGDVYRAPAAPAPATDARLLLAAAVGALIALVGVWVGRRTARSR